MEVGSACELMLNATAPPNKIANFAEILLKKSFDVVSTGSLPMHIRTNSNMESETGVQL
jgi:hypothetical protein